MNLTGPNLDNLISGYVDAVPILPPGVENGEQVAKYYEKKHAFTEASFFNNPRFLRKIEEVAKNQH